MAVNLNSPPLAVVNGDDMTLFVPKNPLLPHVPVKAFSQTNLVLLSIYHEFRPRRSLSDELVVCIENKNRNHYIN